MRFKLKVVYANLYFIHQKKSEGSKNTEFSGNFVTVQTLTGWKASDFAALLPVCDAWPRPCAFALRNYVAALPLLCCRADRQSSCGDSGECWQRRTGSCWETQKRNIFLICGFNVRLSSRLKRSLFVSVHAWDYFLIPSAWNDCWSPRLANGYRWGSCPVDYPSSPSQSHGRARRRPLSAGWMCVNQRGTLSHWWALW